MRPRLHRAAKIRIALRLLAFGALTLAFFAAGDVMATWGMSPLPVQLGVVAAAFAILVMPAVSKLLRRGRARATVPRSLSDSAA